VHCQPWAPFVESLRAKSSAARSRTRTDPRGPHGGAIQCRDSPTCIDARLPGHRCQTTPTGQQEAFVEIALAIFGGIVVFAIVAFTIARSAR
jgi:hypothetical protein